jgi:undecaprenyl diphosphate synthase
MITAPAPFKKTSFSEHKLSLLDETKIPKHIALIPDGNRRWASTQKQTRETGHTRGADIILDITKAARDLGVKYLTLFTFSTENWLRPKDEVNALMILLKHYLISQREPMIENGVRFQTIGDLSQFSDEILKEIVITKEITKKSEAITLTLALNYGGRNDLTRAFQKMIEKGYQRVTEEIIASHLDTADMPDPDLLIRTSGESRLSNFLLFQLSYTEFYTTKTYWPDFNGEDLLDAILDFQQRDRRLGRK